MRRLISISFWLAFAMAVPLAFIEIGLGAMGEGSKTVILRHSIYSPVTTGIITGTVTDAGGNPVAGMNVGAGDYDSIVNCEGGEFWASTEANGTYHLDVSAGTYLVFVNSHGDPGGYIPEAHLDVNSWSQIAAAVPITITAGQTVTGVNFSLPVGFTVSGRLIDAQGDPVPGAGGHIEDPDQDIEFGCALGFGSSDTDGTFQVNVPVGSYDLSFNGTTVRYSIVITGNVDLGDLLFAEASKPPRVFDPQVLEPGYAVEIVVPGGPNCPSDVAVALDGTIYLAAVRSWNVYEVGADETLTSTAPVGVYTLDAGPDGNLYGYFMPDPGPVYRITPEGDVTTVGNLPMTSCESTLAVAPSLDIWIGYNYCGGTGFGDSTLYRMTQAGEIFTVTTDLPCFISALDFDSSGQLYMAMGNELLRVNTADGSYTPFATLPQGASSHGLAAAPDGTLYVSSQGNGNPDRIFKVTPAGAVSTLTTLPAGGLQGLARTPMGDLIATMRCTGALYRVYPDGAWETLLPPNGMATPQAMAFSPAGELFVNNDEAGRIVRITDGQGEFFVEVISYIPPLGHLAFDHFGNLYFSEGAPGFQPRLIKISPQAQVTEVTRDVSFPSGLAFTPDGTLYVAENLSGEVSAVSTTDGTVTTFVDGLTRPQSIAADNVGNLYVAAYEGPLDQPGDPAYDPGLNRIWKIDPSENRTLYAALDVSDLAFSPAGELFITGPVGRQSGIQCVAADGSTKPFANGFLSAVGLAFDLAGNLYVSDDWDNSITRITGFPQGTIQGTVTDTQSSQPISGARLSVVTDHPVVLGAKLTAGGDGRYSLPVAPRTYTVMASAMGYQSASQQVTVKAGVTVTVNLSLTPWLFTVHLPLVAKNYIPSVLVAHIGTGARGEGRPGDRTPRAADAAGSRSADWPADLCVPQSTQSGELDNFEQTNRHSCSR